MEWNGGERGWGGEEERSLSRGWRDEIGVVDTGDQCARYTFSSSSYCKCYRRIGALSIRKGLIRGVIRKCPGV
jgi:hypothetical protein